MELQPTQLMNDDDVEDSRPVPPKPEDEVTERIRQVATLHFGSKRYPLFEGINSVGRSPSCDVVMEDITVSKVHAEIEAHPKTAFVCDLNSSNKTRLNEEVLRPDRYYQVVDGSVIKFGMVTTQFFLLRDCDDSIIVPATPTPVRRPRPSTSNSSASASTSRASTSTSSATLNNSTPSRAQEEADGDDSLFAKPSGPSPRRNKARRIQEIETQPPTVEKSSIKPKRLSIYECETQKDPVAFEEDLSIHEMETQRMDMSSKSASIHDIKADNHVEDDANTSIYEMETQQQPVEKPKKNRKSIYEMETQVGGVDVIPESDDETDDETAEKPKEETLSKYEMETQQIVNTPKNGRKNIHEIETQVVGDHVKSADKNLISESATDRINIHEAETQPVVPRPAIIDETDSDTDDEILTKLRKAQVKQETSIKSDTIDSGSDTDEEGLFEGIVKKKSSPNDQEFFDYKVTVQRSQAESPVLGNSSTERSGFLTPGADVDDLSMQPTQILPITTPRSASPVLNEDDEVKPNSSVPVSKDSKITAVKQPEVDDTTSTQILDDFEYAAMIKKQSEMSKMETNQVDDLAPTQILDPVPLMNINDSNNKKRLAANVSVKLEPKNTAETKLTAVKKNAPTDDSIANELNDMFEGENDKVVRQETPLMTQQLEEILEPSEESQENYFANLHGRKRRNVLPDSNETASGSEATDEGFRGFTNGAAAAVAAVAADTRGNSVVKKCLDSEDNENDEDPLADGNDTSLHLKVSSSDTSSIATPKSSGPRTYSKKPSASSAVQIPVKPSHIFDNDSSDDDFNTKDILKMVDNSSRAGPSTSAKPRKNLKEALSSMEAKAAKKRGRGLKQNIDDSHASSSEVNGTLDSDSNVGVEGPAKKRRVGPKNQQSASKTSNLPGCSTPKRSKVSKKMPESSPSTSVRSRHQQKVIFTGLVGSDPEAIRSAVNQLDGLMVEEPANATVLITDKVRRTSKFFCAVSRSIPIVSMSWIEASLRANEFVNPHEHLLKDPAAEKKYGFDLAQSLAKAKVRLLLDGYTFLITAKVQQPPPADLKRMIEQSGGKCLARAPNAGAWAPNSLIISCEDDAPRVRTMLAVTMSKNQDFPPVITAECILTGILRQELDTDPYLLEF